MEMEFEQILKNKQDEIMLERVTNDQLLERVSTWFVENQINISVSIVKFMESNINNCIRFLSLYFNTEDEARRDQQLSF